jgi:hypothetical protein
LKEDNSRSPKGRRYADVRIPNIVEIRKISEYPDRRIKAIVYSVTSSGTGLDHGII